MVEKCIYCKAFSIELTKDGYVCKKCGRKQQQKKRQYTSPFGEEYSQYIKR